MGGWRCVSIAIERHSHTHTVICCLGILLNSSAAWSKFWAQTYWVNTHYIKSPNLSLICPAVLCVWVNSVLRKSLVLICAVLLLREHWSKALAATSCWYYPFPEPENNCLCVSVCLIGKGVVTQHCLFSHAVLQLIQSTSNYITLLIRCAWVISWVIISIWSK